MKVYFITLLAGLLALFSIGGIAQDASLDSLDEIMAELTAGKLVRGVFTYADMELISDNKVVERVPDAIGGMTIDTFEYFAEGAIGNAEAYLAASESVLINHSGYGIVYNYAKLRIYASGEVELIVQYIDPKTFELEMNESFYGKIGTGARFFKH